MRTLFDAYIMVDWSAANKPVTGKNSIWLGMLVKDARLKLNFVAKNPSTRLEAAQFLSGVIERLHARGDRVLLGFDFPFGYPSGTAHALGCGDDEAPWEFMHALFASKVKEKSDNSNSRYAIAASLNYKMTQGPAPFWGVGSNKDVVSTLTRTKPDFSDLPISEFRICETHVKAQKLAQPSTVWQLAYNGAVGSQAILGLPLVHKMRKTIAGSRVWPFEAPEVDEHGTRHWGEDMLLMAEIYPSVFGASASETKTLDENQVEAACHAFADADKKGQLETLLNAPFIFSDKTSDENNAQNILSEEGWILGVSA